MSIKSTADTTVAIEGRCQLQRLFEIAATRLRERGIDLQFTRCTVDWLLRQPDWHQSNNPLRTLDGIWHKNVGAKIEQLLLEGRLREGHTLTVDVDDAQTDEQMDFDIAASTRQSG